MITTCCWPFNLCIGREKEMRAPLLETRGETIKTDPTGHVTQVAQTNLGSQGTAYRISSPIRVQTAAILNSNKSTKSRQKVDERAATIFSLKKENTNLQEHNAALQEQVKKLQAEMSSGSQRTFSRNTPQIEPYSPFIQRDFLHSTPTASNVLDDFRLAEMEVALGKLENENTSLQQELETAKKAYRELEIGMESNNLQVKSLNLKISQLNDTNHHLKEQLSKLQQAQASEEPETPKSITRSDSNLEQMADVIKIKQESDQLRMQIEELNKQVLKLHNKVNEETEKNALIKCQHEKSLEKYLKIEQEMKDLIKLQKDEISVLKKRLENTSERLTKSRKSTMQEEDYEMHLGKMVNKLEKTQSTSEEIAQLKSVISQKDVQIKETREKNDQYIESLNERIVSLKKEIEMVSSKSLTEHLHKEEQLKSQIRALESDLNSALKRIAENEGVDPPAMIRLPSINSPSTYSPTAEREELEAEITEESEETSLTNKEENL